MIATGGAIDADVLRIRHEFLAKPELVLSVAQVAGLYELSTAHATRLLDTLEAEGFHRAQDDMAGELLSTPQRREHSCSK